MYQKLKFRAFYLHDKKPIQFVWDCRDVGCGFSMEYNPDFFYGAEQIFADDDWVIDAYTGKNDDNGEELYDHDIIQFDWDGKTYTGLITWDVQECAYVVTTKTIGNYWLDLRLGDITDAVTKIGDFYRTKFE